MILMPFPDATEERDTDKRQSEKKELSRLDTSLAQ